MKKLAAEADDRRRSPLWSFCFSGLACLLAFSSAVFGTKMVAQDESTSARPVITEGVQLLRNGHAGQAKAKFDAAVKAAPQSADALTWRGICENQMEQYAAAAADFRAALRFNGAVLPAHYNLALSLIRLHEIDAAIEQLRIVIAAQPGVMQPRYNLAILLEEKEHFADAREQLRVAHTLEPNDSGVTLHLLIDTLKLERTSDVSSLLKDLSEPSTSPGTQRKSGEALLEAGRFSDAAALLERAQETEPAAHGVDLLLARAYIGDGLNSKAIAMLETGTTQIANEEKTYLLALAYLGTGNVRAAVEHFQTAVKLDPRDARPLYHLGLISAAEAQGRTEAVTLLSSATRLNPSNVAYSLALARVLLSLDRAEEARGVLSKTAVDGHDAEIHTLTGVALAATHRVPEAVLQLKQAIQEDATLALAHNLLGFCYFQQGQYAEAASAYGKASNLEPRRVLYAHDAALAYERANQSEQAMIFAERANATGAADASDHVLLGKLYAASNRKSEAVQELRRAVELNPDLDSAYYLLARTSLQMGNEQQANEWSSKLSALKQRHAAAFDLQKRMPPTEIRSSNLLQGGSLSAEEAGAP